MDRRTNTKPTEVVYGIVESHALTVSRAVVELKRAFRKLGDVLRP